MSGTDKGRIQTNGAYIDLGGLWARYDAVGTIKEVPDTNDGPYCQVVLTIPGYKTLGVGCTAEELLAVLRTVHARHEFVTGAERAKGMRV